MASFEPIVEFVLNQEDDPKDPGRIVDLGDGAGWTRLGVTQKNYGTVVPLSFFTTMDFKPAVVIAKQVYLNFYWRRMLCDQIQSDLVAAPLMSFAINDTTRKAVKVLQRVLMIEDDGDLGIETLNELNSKDPTVVANQFHLAWEDYYREITKINPANQRFLDGWINRAREVYTPGVVIRGGIYA